MSIHAYVTMRGSRSSAVTRDASPRKQQPYAALVIGHPDGTSTRFELSYGALENGEIEGGEVTVYLRRQHTTEQGEDVYTGTVKLDRKDGAQ